MKNRLFILLLALAAGSLFGCERPETTSGPNATASPTGTRTAMSDSDLENAIKSRFNNDAQLKAANLDVDADAGNNRATLSGTVESEALRMRAVDMAKAAHAGLVVTDKIDVKPREVSRAEYNEEYARQDRTRARERGDTVGDSLDDAWIHTKIVSKLIVNPDTPERKINVDVRNNTVTLRGNVATVDEKAEAERVAKSTDGVKRVVNQLKVGPASGATPRSNS